MVDRRQFLQSSLCAGISYLSLSGSGVLAADGKSPVSISPEGALSEKISRAIAGKRFDGKSSWSHGRAGIVPGAGKNGAPRVVLVLNSMDLTGSDVFKEFASVSTDDLGETWTEIVENKAMVPRFEEIEGETRPVAASDFWPRWHNKTKVLLGTGHSVVYTPEWKVVSQRPRHTVYSVYNPETDSWPAWKKMEMPQADGKYYSSGAGCTQRWDLADGTILLPIYFYQMRGKLNRSKVTIARCNFDGQELSFIDHGEELNVEDDTRGIGEPSLTRFNDNYYLTIRHNLRAYITRSRDGLNYEPLRHWTFDDGSDLGSYNTQAHWVNHSDGLFLVYTRRGANNDHVLRHRAPLFLGQVDPERLCVIRDTEQVLVPERGATLGNFGVTDVSSNESWVTVAEWMQPRGCEKYGSDGSVFAARIHWKKPNRNFVDQA